MSPTQPGPRIYLTPRGGVLDQPLARDLAAAEGAVFLCGRYEGVDQRVIDAAGMLEVSIGDFILSGGEIAALTVMDTVVRLLPGVIGKEASHREESFETGLLEPSLHPSSELERNRGAGHTGVGSSREDRRMASFGSRAGDAGAPPGFMEQVPAGAGAEQRSEGIRR